MEEDDRELWPRAKTPADSRKRVDRPQSQINRDIAELSTVVLAVLEHSRLLRDDPELAADLEKKLFAIRSRYR